MKATRCQWDTKYAHNLTEKEKYKQCNRTGKLVWIREDGTFTDSGDGWHTTSLRTGKAIQTCLCRQHLIMAFGEGYNILQ